MTQDDAAYLERRASAAIELAEQAACPAAAKAHYLMAAYYLTRLYPPSNEAPDAQYDSRPINPGIRF